MSLVGKKFPSISVNAMDEMGDTFQLDIFKKATENKKKVVLFWYPKDFTFVCPTELHAFQEKLADFESRGCAVVACSTDTEESHWGWLNMPKDKGGIQGVTYPVVADTTKTIATNYGVLFGERMIYFFGIFPIKAKYFVLMIGAYELVVLLSSKAGHSVANLAHLGGLITGAAFLFGWTKYQQGKWRKGGARRNLKLVVNKDEKKPGDGPKYWN